ncbi:MULTISPECIES: MFS transporter [unclassified Pseudoxanthomonas]|uniref:MFS transporter n=1 Tax=unclassified Pseudoxanthomonas TaxID=2645906 RepID=UPI000B859DFA|nr:MULTISPECIES: MFS transporter [unclassified Pseudoxanthomonas]PPJ44121.1 MFS transporter [Pseudoxanthomonas sp. KAs_5_3]
MLPLTALLTSVALLLGGNGLLGTLLAVRSQTEGWGEQTTGLVMSGYFIGFFLGTFTAPPLIRRVGHIRAFAFHAALAAAAVLVFPLWANPVAWMALRVVTGMALVGLCTVIESWLNAQSAPEHRSRVFGVYMVVSLLALAAGQLLLDLQPPRSPVLFSVVAILFALAILPVSITRLSPPPVATAPRVRILQICRTAPSAAAGALLAGMALGAFWGMGAVYAGSLGLDRAGIGTFMAATILGGAALQLPIGRLSDRGDRRSMLAGVSALGAVVAACALQLAPAERTGVLALFFLFGGLAFALYPLAVAHLLDRLPAEQLLAGCSALLLLNGIGAAIGPAAAGLVMERWGAGALPVFFATTLALLALVAGGRRLLKARHLLHPARFHPMVRTTPVALELLPEIPDRPSRPVHDRRPN